MMARQLSQSLKEHISRLRSKEPSNWDSLHNANGLQTPRPSKVAFELGHSEKRPARKDSKYTHTNPFGKQFVNV